MRRYRTVIPVQDEIQVASARLPGRQISKWIAFTLLCRCVLSDVIVTPLTIELFLLKDKTLYQKLGHHIIQSFKHHIKFDSPLISAHGVLTVRRPREVQPSLLDDQSDLFCLYAYPRYTFICSRLPAVLQQSSLRWLLNACRDRRCVKRHKAMTAGVGVGYVFKCFEGFCQAAFVMNVDIHAFDRLPI